MSEKKLLATVVQSALIRSRVASRSRPYPTIMNYPGLSSPAPLWTEYMEKHHGEIVKTLQDNFGAILEEFQALDSLNDTKNASDYRFDEHKLHTGEWDWNSYIQKGSVSGSFGESCPVTVSVLEGLSHIPSGTGHGSVERVNSLVKGMPFSYAFFSSLGPKSEIAAHYGPTNLRIRCHLPLILPDGNNCGIEIGGEIHKWEVGKPFFFDDCFLHRVWNHNEHDKRVLLLFDLWHPELEKEEIEAIKDMFAFLQASSGET